MKSEAFKAKNALIVDFKSSFCDVITQNPKLLWTVPYMLTSYRHSDSINNGYPQKSIEVFSMDFKSGESAISRAFNANSCPM